MAAFEAIAATKLTSATNTVTFLAIPQDYQHLQLRAYLRSARTGGGDTANIRLNNDSGTNYTVHRLYSNRSTGAASSIASRDSAWLASNIPSPGYNSGTASFGVAICDILDYSTTTKATTLRVMQGVDVNNNGLVEFNSSLWSTTSAVTRIDVLCQVDNFVADSVFALYGLRSA